MAVGGMAQSLKAPVSCGCEDAARQRGRLVVVGAKSVFAAAGRWRARSGARPMTNLACGSSSLSVADGGCPRGGSPDIGVETYRPLPSGEGCEAATADCLVLPAAGRWRARRRWLSTSHVLALEEINRAMLLGRVLPTIRGAGRYPQGGHLVTPLVRESRDSGGQEVPSARCAGTEHRESPGSPVRSNTACAGRRRHRTLDE